ncbi:aldehyde oxidase GLOX [Tanacetum coccineum]
MDRNIGSSGIQFGKVQRLFGPKYAIRGQLTRKANIYSCGIMLLEIVSGRPNQNRLLRRRTISSLKGMHNNIFLKGYDNYRFSGTEFPTELRIKAFSPEYLLSKKASFRPITLLAQDDKLWELVKLDVSSAIPDGLGSYRNACIAPPGGRVAPPGYYIVFAVNTGVPSVAKWVKLSNL